MNELLLQFRLLFPEFAAVPDATVLLYLETASKIFNACKEATLYLGAHLIAIDQSNKIGPGFPNPPGAPIDGGGGELTSEKVGELQVTKKPMADTGLETYYTSTPYGRRYLALKKVCAPYVFSPRTFAPSCW